MFCAEGFKQAVTKPMRDSGTLIYHVYVSNSLHVDSDVSDCYYSDHDHVLCAFNIKLTTFCNKQYDFDSFI